MNWRLKILIKIILYHLPLNYSFWQKLGLFKLGSMDSPEYAEKIFKLHVSRVFKDKLPSGLTFLELGPGDSLASALIAHAYGVEKIYLVDSGNFANHDLKIYQQISEYLTSHGLKTIDMSSVSTIEEILSQCNAVYLTQGLQSLQAIPDNSVDFVWSHSVLEHIRKKDFEKTFIELYRIIKPDAWMSHNVDLMDHLGGALNNLRFSEDIWENKFFANSGFYTNRIRYSEMINIIKNTGFNLLDSDYSCWDSLPTTRKTMVEPFNQWQEEDLLIRCCHFLVKKTEHLG